MADTGFQRTDAPTARPPSADESRWKWAVEKLALPAALCLAPLLYQTLAERSAATTRQEAKTAARKLADERATAAQKLADERALKAAEEQKLQLYTTFLTKREEADSGLRHGLFDRLLFSYFKPSPTDPYHKLVELELLAVNFHDSLNLNPLFWDMHRVIEQMPQRARRADLRVQLDRVATEVKGRQVAALGVGGHEDDFDVYLDFISPNNIPFEKTINAQLQDPTTQKLLAERQFTLRVLNKDDKNRRLQVLVSSDSGNPPFEAISFWVDVFDFPLSNFSRVSSNERLAIVLSSYNDPKGVAKLAFLYFPSTRSAGKDKPYIDELIAKFLPQQVDKAAIGVPGSGASTTPKN